MIAAGGRDKKQDGGSVDAVSIQKLMSSVANDNVPGGRVSAAYWRVRAFVGRGDWSGAWWACTHARIARVFRGRRRVVPLSELGRA